MTKKQVAVIGAGTMGNGIAHAFAAQGHAVVLMDVSEATLRQALETIGRNFDRQIKKGTHTEQQKREALSLIQTCTDLSEGVQKADWVVEAATENLSLKKQIFAQLDQHAPEKSILSTNTSSLSITEIASQTRRPEQVIGMHFMNPVPVMKLVEVVRGYRTSEETVQATLRLSEQLDKIPVLCEDYPGFVANRLLMPMINEAVYALHEGVAKAKDIDQIMTLGLAHPMGPLQLADFIGLDVCLSILQVLHKGFGHPKYAPCPLLVNMVQAGHLGRKSGKGFYDYEKKK